MFGLTMDGMDGSGMVDGCGMEKRSSMVDGGGMVERSSMVDGGGMVERSGVVNGSSMISGLSDVRFCFSFVFHIGNKSTL